MIIHACLDKEGSVHVCKSGSIETIRPSLCFSFCRSVYNWSKIFFINFIRDVSDTFVCHKALNTAEKWQELKQKHPHTSPVQCLINDSLNKQKAVLNFECGLKK